MSKIIGNLSLPQTADELEAMNTEEIDVIIAELRRRQKESASVKFRSARTLGVWGDAFGDGLDGGMRKWGKDLGILNIDEDGFVVDAENLQGDLERVGCDMWIGLLQHAKLSKNTPLR